MFFTLGFRMALVVLVMQCLFCLFIFQSQPDLLQLRHNRLLKLVRKQKTTTTKEKKNLVLVLGLMLLFNVFVD